MAKSIIEEELAERTQKLREGLDKMVARHGIDGVWNHKERTARDDEDRRKWLDETQNMRVVALNEAVDLVKCLLNNKNLVIDSRMVTSYAKAFAEFLVEGKA